jgi:hypothetical protein
MSTRIKNVEIFPGFNPVLKRLMERGFPGIILPRLPIFPDIPALLQEKFHLITQRDLKIASRFENGGWVISQKPHLDIAPIWRLIVESRESVGKK